MSDSLTILEAGRRRRPSGGETLRALESLRAAPPAAPADVARLHEALLFHAAYPETAAVQRLSLRLLKSLARDVARRAASGEDLSALDPPEIAGIAGTTVATTFTYDFLRGLAARHPGAVRVDWDAFEGQDRMGATLPRFLPLLDEEALADANVSYRAWIGAARGREGELEWILKRFAGLPLPPQERAELFDGLGLPVVWELSGEESRTLARLSDARPWIHAEPLLARHDVNVSEEMASPPLPVRRVSRREGLRRLDFARDANGTRYRELYGFTYGDPDTARVADAGRGCEITLFGLPPGRRLPLRAGYAALVTRNGIPVAYVEGLGLFERLEVGFNVYYTFREGESAWIYARVLKLFRQVLGATSFSIDPYQIGSENEEAVASGAFWFYRKLGFRSASAKLRTATGREEEKLARDPKRRTPARILRNLAGRNVLFDAGPEKPDWDRFHVRGLGLAVNRRMRRESGGDAAALRKAALARVSRTLGVDISKWPEPRRRGSMGLIFVLDAISGLARWTAAEKEAAAAILRAKSGREEDRYLRLLQRHGRLREAVIQMGSRELRSKS
ncbi:MAG: hypothetical protein LC796_13920 [Acidobacteria bacterium]|nr:hypothetical protein [Acidobacteriota bacterium]